MPPTAAQHKVFAGSGNKWGVETESYRATYGLSPEQRPRKCLRANKQESWRVERTTQRGQTSQHSRKFERRPRPWFTSKFTPRHSSILQQNNILNTLGPRRLDLHTIEKLSALAEERLHWAGPATTATEGTHGQYRL